MITSCRNSGFHILFSNGWTASVQWGPGNYCDNSFVSDRLMMPFAKGEYQREWASKTAECWAWVKEDDKSPSDCVNFPDGGPLSYQKPEEVVHFLDFVSKFPDHKLPEGDILETFQSH
jgi:hypothetical protein